MQFGYRLACVFALSVGLGVSVLSCSLSASPSRLDAEIQVPAVAQAPVVQEDLAQVLPISAEAEIAGEMIQLEVARTPEQQAQGLMYRPPLPDDRGMLFPFQPPRPVQFWMHNTPSPLDMVFLLDGEVKAIIADVPPCAAQPCPTYGPRMPVNQVIELRAGRAAELGLQVGDRITIRERDPAAIPAAPQP